MSETPGETELLLKELVSFLAPSTRVDIRIEAAKGILLMSAQETLRTEAPQVKLAWETIVIPQLVKWIGDQPQISKPCIEALTNLAAISIFSPNSSFITSKTSFWRWLFEDILSSGPLLVNLTAHPQGPGKIEQHVIGGSGRACAELLAIASNAKSPAKAREYCLSATRNLTLDTQARNSFTKSSLALLCGTMVEKQSTVEMRRDAAGALRNLLLEKDVEMVASFLDVDGAGFLGASLLLRLPRSELDLKEERGERNGMSPVLLKVFNGDFKFIPVVSEEVEDMVIECLLLCAASRTGRERMRAVQLYAALRSYHPTIMDDGESPNEVLSAKVYELVEFLISDEEEGEVEEAGDAAFEVD
ncbi:hypothetical protein BASA81_001073 [Batrachochytrium salamandrivorans]|nr:hypothetical protein BASA81_001073 [Batrachochytrium salamandrivorans]